MTSINNPRGPSNKNLAGNSTERKRRRQWLLDTFGNGEFVACFRQISPRCLWVLDSMTLTVDRVVPGCAGGRYCKGNVLPVCGSCNSMAGNLERWKRPIPGPTTVQLLAWAQTSAL